MTTPASPSPDPTAENPPRHRRWIPVSLRMFVAILVLLGVSTVWIGVAAWRQQMVLREIERLGGSVCTNMLGPEWLRRQVGQQRMMMFEEVVGVFLGATEASDATLRQLGSLTGLQYLRLENTPVTDAGVSNLRDLFIPSAAKYTAMPVRLFAGFISFRAIDAIIPVFCMGLCVRRPVHPVLRRRS